MRRSIVVLTVISLLGATLAGMDIVTPRSAQAAATTRVVTGATITATADAVRAITHPTSASKGIVVAAADTLAIAQGSALANATGAALIVSNSTTNPTAVNSTVRARNITQLTFVGSASAFPSTFRNAVDSRVTVKTTVLNNDVFTRSRALVPANVTAFAMAKTTDVAAVEAALSFASATDSALLLFTGSEAPGTLRSYLQTFADPAIAVLGDPGITSEFDPDDYDKFVELRTNDPAATDAVYAQIVQQHVDKKGRAANKLTTVPGDDLASFALATLVGRVEQSVTIPAGNRSAITTDSSVDRYLRLVNSELKSLSLVGVSTTATQLSAVATPAATPRSARPAWTVTNVDLGSGNYNLTYSARPDAVRYSALEFDNSVIATSNTTTMVIPGVPDFATIAAYNSTGTELERIYFRSNSYTTSTDRPSVVYGTVRNGSVDLVFLGAANVPRKIVRTYHDPYATMDAPKPEPAVIAITCAGSFTDVGLDPEVQWTYEVINLTLRTGTGCGAAAGTPIGGNGLPTAAVTLPLTQDPYAPRSYERGTGEDLAKPRIDPDNPTRVLPRAGQTTADAVRQRLATPPDTSVDTSGIDQRTSAASGSTGWGFEFIYEGYIPEAAIVSPGYSGNSSQPIILYNGSDREWWDHNNVDTKFTMHAFVGQSSVSFLKYFGETRRYHCGYDPFRNTGSCTRVATATAPDSQMTTSATISGSTTTMNFTVAGKNPLEPFAPTIDGTMQAELTPRVWTLRGSHDLMPVHQFWAAQSYSEGVLVYSSHGFYFVGCLFGGPACTATVNVQM